jgi:hypothetical protein
MRKHLRPFGVGSALLLTAGLGWWATADARPAAEDKGTALIDKPVLPEADLTQLIDHDAKIVQAALATGKPDKKSVTRAKAASYMVALYSQQLAHGDKGPAMATLRDTALAVADALVKDDFATAQTLAKNLSSGIAPNPAAKTAPVPLHTVIDIADLMSQFKVARSGGQDLEKQMNDLIKKPTSSIDLKAVGLLSDKAAAISQLTEAMPPAGGGGKDPKKWVQWSQEMRSAALDAGKAAKSGKAADAKAALKKMEASCTSCHNVFRDNG